MLFYIPGILVLIVVILICIFLIPRLAPSILAITALVLLILGLYHHYALFANEYRMSTWQEGLKFWAGPVMIALLILTIVGYFTIFLGSGGKTASLPVNVPMPPAKTATNVVTETINNAMNSASKVGNSIVTTMNNTLKPNVRTNLQNQKASNLSSSFYEKV
jgi:hypothetical protein